MKKEEASHDVRGQPTAEGEDESKLYPLVRDALESYFRLGSEQCVFKVTAEGVSGELEERLPDEILFLLGSRELRPDILGYVQYPTASKAFYYHSFFVTAEVKGGVPTINDLFQAKKYGEIYGAAISLLVSTLKPEQRLLRLLKRKSVLLHLPMTMYSEYLCTFSTKDNVIDWWFPEEPRRKES